MKKQRTHMSFMYQKMRLLNFDRLKSRDVASSQNLYHKNVVLGGNNGKNRVKNDENAKGNLSCTR